jgi:hypothetical protein
MEPTECSETSAFNIQTPGKYPEENLPYLQHGESLKTTIIQQFCVCAYIIIIIIIITTTIICHGDGPHVDPFQS